MPMSKTIKAPGIEREGVTASDILLVIGSSR